MPKASNLVTDSNEVPNRAIRARPDIAPEIQRIGLEHHNAIIERSDYRNRPRRVVELGERGLCDGRVDRPRCVVAKCGPRQNIGRCRSARPSTAVPEEYKVLRGTAGIGLGCARQISEQGCYRQIERGSLLRVRGLVAGNDYVAKSGKVK